MSATGLSPSDMMSLLKGLEHLTNIAGIAGVAKAVGGKVVVTELVDPKNIRFTQNSIKNTFKDGSSLDDLIGNLVSKKVTADDLPPIRTFFKDGKIYSLDNRRLYAFQKADVLIKTRPATLEEIANEAFKFTSRNDGVSIVIRGAQQ